MKKTNEKTPHTLKHRDFITLKDFSRDEIEALLDLALKMKGGDDRAILASML